MSESAGAKNSPFAELIDFKIFSEEVSAVTKDNGEINTSRPQIRGIGSSESEDLSGDRMLESALKDMEKYSVRSPIWMNHRYSVPYDIFGKLAFPPKTKLYPPGGPGVIKSDRPYYGVEIVADVSRINKAAMDSFSIITEDEVRLGFSIGCQIMDWDVRKSDDGDPLGFDVAHLRTLEWSLVGIPCNQDSWVENAVKGLIKRYSNAPVVKTAEEALYVRKHYRDFDDVTALYIKRSFDPKVANYLAAQQKVYKKYGLRLVQDLDD